VPRSLPPGASPGARRTPFGAPFEGDADGVGPRAGDFTLRLRPIQTVEWMTPVTSLPHIIFAPQAPSCSISMQARRALTNKRLLR
jgi:hypothetical protein